MMLHLQQSGIVYLSWYCFPSSVYKRAKLIPIRKASIELHSDSSYRKVIRLLIWLLMKKCFKMCFAVGMRSNFTKILGYRHGHLQKTFKTPKYNACNSSMVNYFSNLPVKIIFLKQNIVRFSIQSSPLGKFSIQDIKVHTKVNNQLIFNVDNVVFSPN